MTRELIIEGQHVDLAPDTDITLEYTSNILGDIGKISLSHSYTIKLPKTIRNARILDDPDNVSRQSSATRRYLSARFYRNDIDLIGPAQAYILKTTPESYEIALVWNTLDALQIPSQSSATLNDLPNLPTLTWIGPNGSTPDYTGGNDAGGGVFAFYNSGLGRYSYPEVNTSTHPCLTISNLISRIFREAGVMYELTRGAQADLEHLALLAAPKHVPSQPMEQASGSTKKTGVYLYAGDAPSMSRCPLRFENLDGSNYEWIDGWDSVYGGVSMHSFAGVFIKGENDYHRIRLNLKSPEGLDLSGARLVIMGVDYSDGIVNAKTSELLSSQFLQRDGYYYVHIDESINVSGWPQYEIWIRRDGGVFENITQHLIEFDAYELGHPLVSINREHDAIRPDKDNRFPLQGNLPDIKQWDLIKACMAMLGWAAVIQNGALFLVTYSELLNTSGAYDWTSKVDMSDGGRLELGFTLNNWAQANTFMFQEDTPLVFAPNATLMIQATTLPEQRTFYELPFAASMQSDAHHYKVDGTDVEDIDIAPRVFKVVDKEGVRTLEFTKDLYGEKLKAAHYAQVQEVIRKPIVISVNVRLHELDLAQLDLTRTVYLGQFGHYYKVLKVQTSATDLCKVELIQIA